MQEKLICWSLISGKTCRCVAITRNYSGVPHNGVAGKSNRGQTNSRSEHLWAAVWVCAKEKHYRYCIWMEVVDRKELRRSEGAALHFGRFWEHRQRGSWGRNVVQGWETLLGGRVFRLIRNQLWIPSCCSADWQAYSKVRQGSPGTMFVNDTVICGGDREPIQLEKCPGGGKGGWQWYKGSVSWSIEGARPLPSPHITRVILYIDEM